MNMRAVLTGRLGQDPVSGSTKSGATMTTTSIAVAVNRPTDPPLSEWFALVGFGNTGELLAEHAKGDVVTVSGLVTKSNYTRPDGSERQSWSINVDGILSVRGALAQSERPTKSPQRRQARQSLSNRSFRPAFHDDSVEDLWRGGLVP